MKSKFAVGIALSVCASFAMAQGIPVIDGANLVNSIQQVVAWKAQYDQMFRQISQMEAQIKATTGNRGMGSLLSNSSVRQTVPTNFLQGFDTLRRSGVAGASSAAKSIYDGIKVFGCDQKFPTDLQARRHCETGAMMTPNNVALINQSMSQSQARAAELQTLVNQIDAAEDPKAAADLQNRINAEIALLNNEKQMMDMALAAQQQQLELTRQQKAEEGTRRVQIGTGTNPFNQK